MENEVSTVLISGKGLIFLWIYLASMIVVGFIARYYRKEVSMSDFYLSGRGIGFFVLLLTLYATQYSGNTLIGFSGKAYRSGFYFLVSVGFMMGVIAVWLIYAPKLQRLSRKFKFITIGDYIQHRFGSRRLTTLATILCIIALGNYILTNLKAVGTVMEASTGGAVNPVVAIIIAAFIMVIYETLGGMRSVAWTDTIQGILLLIGCAAIIWGVYYFFDGLQGAAQVVMDKDDGILWNPPTGDQKISWISTLIVGSIGIALYPHAIQRIYAAKDEKTLRRSFQVMVFMPLVTTLFILIVGIVGISVFPDLTKEQSEGVSMLVLSDLAQKAPWFSAVAVLFICAAIAAIMSTVDSALLAISSMFSQDLYKPYNQKATQATLVKAGKISSWVVMAIGTLLAIVLPQTIWRLIEIKWDILCQVAPALLMGLYLKNLDKRAVFSGMIAGIVVVVFLLIAKDNLGLNIEPKPFKIHAGIWGMALNLIVMAFVTMLRRGNREK